MRSPPWTGGSSCWRRTWRGPRRGSPPPPRSWPRPPMPPTSRSGKSLLNCPVRKITSARLTTRNNLVSEPVGSTNRAWPHNDILILSILSMTRIRKALENKSNMEDDRVAILEAQLAQAKLIAEEADKKYEEVESESSFWWRHDVALISILLQYSLKYFWWRLL